MATSLTILRFFFFTLSGGDEEWRNNFSEREAPTIKKSKRGADSTNSKESKKFCSLFPNFIAHLFFFFYFLESHLN